MKKRLGQTFIVWAAAIALMVTGAAAAYGAGAPAAKTYRIAAIGDSITVGYEPGITNASAIYGYVDRLYEQALFHGRAKVDNFGILGLRTEGLLRLLQGAADGKPLKSADIQDFPSPEDPRITAQADGVGARTNQLKTALAQADVVVMTIGANDFTGFLKSMLEQPKEAALKTLDDEMLNRVNKYAEEAEQAVRQANALAPNARIFLTDQYLPLPKLFSPDLYDPLYEKAVAPLTAAVDGLAAKLRAEGLNVEAVRISDKFARREGSMTHMRKSLTGDSQPPPDIHPSQTGYEAIAEAFANAIWQEHRQPSARAAGVPFSVIVGGRELKSANKPAMKNKTPYVELGDALKAMRTTVKWTAKTKTAVFQTNGRKVTITIGAKTMLVNGAKQKLDAAAYVQKVGKGDKIYVPLAVFSIGLNYDAVFRDKLQTAFINP